MAILWPYIVVRYLLVGLMYNPAAWVQGLESPTGLDMARCIATARITMPRSVVRLSAGRLELSTSDQVNPSPLGLRTHTLGY
jgi:biotin synthase-like enzyme